MIFVDTGALLARYLRQDQYHRLATETWQRLEQTPLVTSNFVLDETLTLLGRRASYAFAAERFHSIYASNAFTILRPALADELAAVKLFTKYADQRVSFTDALSFVLMRKQGIRQVFSFDQHFSYAGFKLIPPLDV